jgi:hypothetical protein
MTCSESSQALASSADPPFAAGWMNLIESAAVDGDVLDTELVSAFPKNR